MMNTQSSNENIQFSNEQKEPVIIKSNSVPNIITREESDGFSEITSDDNYTSSSNKKDELGESINVRCPRIQRPPQYFTLLQKGRMERRKEWEKRRNALQKYRVSAVSNITQSPMPLPKNYPSRDSKITYKIIHNKSSITIPDINSKLSTVASYYTLGSNLWAHIYYYLPLTDRLVSIPLVCRQWLHNITLPECWERVKLTSLSSVLTTPRLISLAIYSPPDYNKNKNINTKYKKIHMFQKLISLNLARCTKLEGLSSFLPYTPNLLHLSLERCSQIDDKVLLSISSLCKSLHTIILHTLPLITETGLNAIVTGCTELRSLIVDDCVCVGDNLLKIIGCKLHKLEELGARNSSITNEGVSFLQSLSLSRLYIGGCKNITEEVFPLLSPLRNTLQEIDITGCSMKEINSFSLHKLRCISMNNISGDNGLKLIIECCGHYLREMSVFQNEQESNIFITDSTCELLSKNCPYISHLHLTDVSLSSSGFEFIAKLINLKKLHIEGLFDIESPFIPTPIPNNIKNTTITIRASSADEIASKNKKNDHSSSSKHTSRGGMLIPPQSIPGIHYRAASESASVSYAVNKRTNPINKMELQVQKLYGLPTRARASSESKRFVSSDDESDSENSRDRMGKRRINKEQDNKRNVCYKGLFLLIQECKKLESFSLFRLGSIGDEDNNESKKIDNDEDIQLNEFFIKCVSEFSNQLQELELSCGLDDNTIRLLSQGCPKLRKLHLVNCNNMTDNSAYFLAQFFTLRELVLMKCSKFTVSALKFLSNGCNHLEHLDVHGLQDVNVSDIVPYMVKRCLKLKKLVLNDTSSGMIVCKGQNHI